MERESNSIPSEQIGCINKSSRHRQTIKMAVNTEDYYYDIFKSSDEFSLSRPGFNLKKADVYVAQRSEEKRKYLKYFRKSK